MLTQFRNYSLFIKQGDNMKYALIGCGRVAPSHIKAAKLNNLEISAVCDLDYEKAVKFSRDNEIDGVKIYTDYKQMLEAEKPEFVAIATDSGAHAEISLYCAQNKVNFLVEKPMAMSMDDADRVIEAVERNGVTAGVCHQNRFNIAVQELRAAIEDGRFGKISNGSICIRWSRGESYYSNDAWRGKYATDGGTLMNQCIHGIDLLRWMLGEDIKAVSGFTRNLLHPYIEAEDIGVGVVAFENGAVATIEGTVNATEDFEQILTVIGEKGTVRLGGMNANTVDFWSFTDSKNADEGKTEIYESAPNVYGNGHTSLYLDFISAINENRKPYVDLYAGKNAVEVVLAIYKSQKTGETVRFPLQGFGSADMTED